MKYANRLNVLLVLIGAVIVFYTLSRTFWSPVREDSLEILTPRIETAGRDGRSSSVTAPPGRSTQSKKPRAVVTREVERTLQTKEQEETPAPDPETPPDQETKPRPSKEAPGAPTPADI